MTTDPASTAGHALQVAERTGLLVIGAGPAGIAAALEGRRAGLHVVLADENPVPAETMGDDIPHLFGAAQSGAARNRTAMTEALLAARPELATAFEAGVDVRLGTACWGLYANGPAVGWLPGPVAGLHDAGRAWMLGFNRAVVATGCRDMGVAFPGWDLPGVSGVLAAAALAELGAYGRRRAVLLGTGADAVAAARRLAAAGVELAAVIEVAAAPLTDPACLPAPLLCGIRALRAEGGPDGVEALVITSADGERRLPCDAVLLGVGAVPVIDLLDAAGCRIAFDPARGGWVPVLDGAQRTTLPFISAAGSCTGTGPAKAADPAVAEAEGRRAATATDGAAPPPDAPGHLDEYRASWVRALVVEGTPGLAEGTPGLAGGTYVCRCEEVTAREILELRPPRYLNAPAAARNDNTLRALLGAGPPNPDQVKRLTRAGMGLCQGRRCREQVACLLALGTGQPLADIPPATHRAPVRPLPLRLAGSVEEPAAMRRHWDLWFGMPSQYAPAWDVPPAHTARGRKQAPEPAGE